MATDASDLGSHVATYGPSGGFTGFQNRPGVRTALFIIAGLFFGFVPGLIVALVTDLVPALIVGPLLGAVATYFWARSLKLEAGVTQASLYARGVVFVDERGTSQTLTWGQIASIQGRHLQNVASTPIGDVQGATNHMYALRTHDGRGFLLDDRVANVPALADALARASGVPVTPLR